MPNKRIYILEDSEDIQDILTMVFEEEGYEVKSFSTVGEFNTGRSLTKPDIYLLDVMLPDGNGLDVCAELKENELTSGIPVVIMTANSQIEKMKTDCLAEKFISKPFDIFEVADIVSQLTA